MKNAVRLLKIGGFRLIMSMGFFILALRFLKIWKKLKNAVAFFRNTSYKEVQGKNLPKL